MFSRLSIRQRLVGLSSFLLLILVGTDGYLTIQLYRGSSVLAKETEIARVLDDANSAAKAFGDLKFWFSDSALSQLLIAERNAEAALGELNRQLDTLASHEPESVATIRKELSDLQVKAMLAVDEYANDSRVSGNALMSEARKHIGVIDTQLDQLVQRQRAYATSLSDQALADHKNAVVNPGRRPLTPAPSSAHSNGDSHPLRQFLNH